MSTYLTVQREGYSFLSHMVTEYRIATNRQYTGGPAKRDRMVHDARVKGEQDGMALGLVTHVTQARVARYTKLDQIRMPAVDEANEFLDRAIHLLEEGRELDEDELWGGIYSEYKEFCFPESIEQDERDRRQAAILAGEEQPTAEDREWLAERAQKAREEAERLSQFVS